MGYDFDTPIDRRNTNAMKWNVGEEELPMWVADMDFQTAPQLRAALKKRVEHGVFGYSEVPGEWQEAYVSWWKRRHGFLMEPENLIFCTGVVPAISSIVRKLTTPNENVVLLTPVYNIFFNSIRNNGARVLECPLAFTDGVYSIDFSCLEKALSDPQTSLLIFCNPHNPVGKIWSADTLSRVGELCERYHVTVISDEIHCDLVRPGCGYTPFAAASEVCKKISITCLAPTKAFNIAGLQSAACYIPDPALHHKVWRALNTDEVAEPNSFATLAAVTAFHECGDWLDELNDYLFENRRLISEFLSSEVPEVSAVWADATYLVWLDVRRFPASSEEIADKLRETTGLYVLPGSEYGAAGEGFLRMNIACPKQVLLDGMERLKRGMTLLCLSHKPS